MGTAIMLITHDMGVIAEMADNVMVMYAGNMVEYGDTATILNHPEHPYTKALMEAVPRLDEEKDKLNAIPGIIPGLTNMPDGCHFNPRCKYATNKCKEMKPEESFANGRKVCCWNLELAKEGE